MLPVTDCHKSEIGLTRMLSPHEFSTLMMIKDAPDQIEPDRAELHKLLERNLVIDERLASGHQRLHITPHGHAILQAISRLLQD
jgi:hypothetical protein